MVSDKNKPVLPEDPKEAEPGRGAPGNNHSGVQLAQTINVNPSDERIPADTDTQKNIDQLKAYREQEKGTGMDTTGGFGITESGNLTNVAIEPEMYVEE